MLSKNNFQERLRKMQPKKERFSIRKFSVGAASVLIGFTIFGMNHGESVKADTINDAQTINLNNDNKGNGATTGDESSSVPSEDVKVAASSIKTADVDNAASNLTEENVSENQNGGVTTPANKDVEAPKTEKQASQLSVAADQEAEKTTDALKTANEVKADSKEAIQAAAIEEGKKSQKAGAVTLADVQKKYDEIAKNSASMTEEEREQAANELKAMTEKLSAADQFALANMNTLAEPTQSQDVSTWDQFVNAFNDRNIGQINLTGDITISGKVSGINQPNKLVNASKLNFSGKGIARKLTINGNHHKFDFGEPSKGFSYYLEFTDNNQNDSNYDTWDLTFKDMDIHAIGQSSGINEGAYAPIYFGSTSTKNEERNTVTFDGVNATVDYGPLIAGAQHISTSDQAYNKVVFKGNNIINNTSVNAKGNGNANYGSTIDVGTVVFEDGKTTFNVGSSKGNNAMNYGANVIRANNAGDTTNPSVWIKKDAQVTINAKAPDIRGIMTNDGASGTVKGNVIVDGKLSADMQNGHSTAIATGDLTINNTGSVDITTKQDNQYNGTENSWANAETNYNGHHFAPISLGVGVPHGSALQPAADSNILAINGGSLRIVRNTGKTNCGLISFGSNTNNHNSIHSLLVNGGTLDLQDNSQTIGSGKAGNAGNLGNVGFFEDSPKAGMITLYGTESIDNVEFNNPTYINLQRTGTLRGTFLRLEGTRNITKINSSNATPLSQWDQGNKTSTPSFTWYLTSEQNSSNWGDFAATGFGTSNSGTAASGKGSTFINAGSTSKVQLAGNSDNPNTRNTFENNFNWWQAQRISIGDNSSIKIKEADKYEPDVKEIAAHLGDHLQKETNGTPDATDTTGKTVKDGISGVTGPNGKKITDATEVGKIIDWSKTHWYDASQDKTDYDKQFTVISKEGQESVTNQPKVADFTKVGKTSNTATIVYTDGTKDFVDVPITVNDDAGLYTPSYPEQKGLNDKGQTVTPSIKDKDNKDQTIADIISKDGKKPGFVITDKDTKFTIDPTTGVITIPKGATPGEYNVPVTVTYKDGSKDTTTAKVTVDDAPKVSGIKVGSDGTVPDPSTGVTNFNNDQTTEQNGYPSKVEWKNGTPTFEDGFKGTKDFEATVTYPDGTKTDVSIPVSVTGSKQDGDNTTYYGDQSSVEFKADAVDTHKTTGKDTVYLYPDDHQFNQIIVKKGWDREKHTYAQTITYNLDKDGKTFVNATDANDKFDATKISYTWQNGFAPNSDENSFKDAQGNVIKGNTLKDDEAEKTQKSESLPGNSRYRYDFTVSDASVASKLGLPTNYKSWANAYYNFYTATPKDGTVEAIHGKTDSLPDAATVVNTDYLTSAHNSEIYKKNSKQDIKWVPNSVDFTKASKQTGKVRITFADGTHLDVEVPVNVKNNEADDNTPAGKATSIKQGDKLPDAKKSVDPNSIKKVPTDTTYTWTEGKQPDPTKPGKQNVEVTVTYPDKTTDKVTTTVTVDAKPTTKPISIDENSTNPDPTPSITNINNGGDKPADGYPTSVTWKDGKKPDVTKPGKQNVEVTVHYPDGTTQDTTIPVVVTEQPKVQPITVNPGQTPDVTKTVTNVDPSNPGKPSKVEWTDGKAPDTKTPGVTNPSITVTYPDLNDPKKPGKTVTTTVPVIVVDPSTQTVIQNDKGAVIVTTNDVTTHKTSDKNAATDATAAIKSIETYTFDKDGKLVKNANSSTTGVTAKWDDLDTKTTDTSSVAKTAHHLTVTFGANSDAVKAGIAKSGDTTKTPAQVTIEGATGKTDIPVNVKDAVPTTGLDQYLSNSDAGKIDGATLAWKTKPGTDGKFDTTNTDGVLEYTFKDGSHLDIPVSFKTGEHIPTSNSTSDDTNLYITRTINSTGLPDGLPKPDTTQTVHYVRDGYKNVKDGGTPIWNDWKLADDSQAWDAIKVDKVTDAKTGAEYTPQIDGNDVTEVPADTTVSASSRATTVSASSRATTVTVNYVETKTPIKASDDNPATTDVTRKIIDNLPSGSKTTTQTVSFSRSDDKGNVGYIVNGQTQMNPWKITSDAKTWPEYSVGQKGYTASAKDEKNDPVALGENGLSAQDVTGDTPSTTITISYTKNADIPVKADNDHSDSMTITRHISFEGVPADKQDTYKDQDQTVKFTRVDEDGNIGHKDPVTDVITYNPWKVAEGNGKWAGVEVSTITEDDGSVYTPTITIDDKSATSIPEVTVSAGTNDKDDKNTGATKPSTVKVVYTETTTPHKYTAGDGKANDDSNLYVTRTIKYTVPEGQTAIADQVQTVHYVRKDNKGNSYYTDKDGKKTYVEWTLADGQSAKWDAKDVNQLTNYDSYVDGNKGTSVAEKAVTADTDNVTINVTYTANDGQQTINYVDGNGNKVGDQVVSGKTDANVPVTPELPDGWVVDTTDPNNKVPETVTIKSTDTPITVTVKHGETTVQPTDPKKPGDKIPGTKDKHYPDGQPTGIDQDDLNKTITRTVKIKNTDGSETDKSQSLSYTRTATIDTVTGKVKSYGNWTPTDSTKTSFTEIDVPDVAGYTPTETKVDAQTPTNDEITNWQDPNKTITYNANSGQMTFTFVDDNNKGATVGTPKTLTGKTGDTVATGLTLPENYKLAKNNTIPDNYTFKATNTPVSIHLVHDTEDVSNSDAKAKKTVSYKVTEVFNGKTTDRVNASATFTRTATKDKVTGQTTYGAWTGTEKTIQDTDIAKPGYTAKVNDQVSTTNKITGTTLTADSPENTVYTVTYEAKDHTKKINFVDNSDKKTVVHTQTVTGKTGQTVTVTTEGDTSKLEVPTGWTIVTPQDLPGTITFGADEPAASTVYIEHKKDVTDGRNDQNNRDVYRKVTRTITVNIEGQKPQTVTQELDFYRTKTVDEVKQANGDADAVTYGDWTSNMSDGSTSFKDLEIPSDAGYTMAVTGGTTAKKDGKNYVAGQSGLTDKKEPVENINVTVDYKKADQSFNVKFVNNDNHDDVVSTQSVSGKIGDTVKLTVDGADGSTKLNVPTGWEIVGGNPTITATFGNTLLEDQTVYIQHKKTTVNVDKDNWDTYRTTTETVYEKDPVTGEEKQVANIPLTFTRTGVKDEVTNTTNWSNWTPNTKDSKTGKFLTNFPEVDVTKSAYTATSTDGTVNKTADGKFIVPASDNIDPDTLTKENNVHEIHVTYTADTLHQKINFVDNSDKKIVVGTQDIIGTTGQTVTVTKDGANNTTKLQVPNNWKVVGGYPGTINFGTSDGETQTVYIEHATQDVTNDPDANKETPSSKTVTYKVIERFNGQDKTLVDKSQTFTRTLTKDLVTGQVTPGTWKEGNVNVGAVDVAKVGYTAAADTVDLVDGKVPAFTISPDSESKTVVVTYTAGSHKMTYTFHDDTDNKDVKTSEISGNTDQTVDTNLAIPEGYKLAEGQSELPKTYKFGSADASETIHLVHATKTVDKDNVPDGYTEDKFSKTIKRTITVTKPGETTPEDHSQTTTITRTGTYDEVTKTVNFGEWTKGSFEEFDAPTVDGYTPSQSEVPEIDNVTVEYVDTPVNITYTADDSHQTFHYVDKDGKPTTGIPDARVTGKTDDQKHGSDVPVPDGWELVDTPSDFKIPAPDKDTAITVKIKHGETTVTPEDPKTPDDNIPGTKDQHFPSGVDHDHLNKTISRTITIENPDGTKNTITQELSFKRKATVDNVSHDVTYGDWTPADPAQAKFEAVVAPHIDGYTADKTAPELTPSNDEITNWGNHDVTISYTKDKTQADKNTPKSQDITVKKGDTPNPKDGIKNSGDLDKLPDPNNKSTHTSYTWKDKTPDTSKTGDTTGTVVVTYPDGSKDEVNVTIHVKDNTPEPSDADKYTPSYPDVVTTPGKTTTTDVHYPEDKTPTGNVTYTKDPKTPDWINVDPSTGKITVTVPENHPTDVITVPVTVTYPDGTTDKPTVTIDIVSGKPSVTDPTNPSEVINDPNGKLPDGTKVEWTKGQEPDPTKKDQPQDTSVTVTVPGHDPIEIPTKVTYSGEDTPITNGNGDNEVTPTPVPDIQITVTYKDPSGKPTRTVTLTIPDGSDPSQAIKDNVPEGYVVKDETKLPHVAHDGDKFIIDIVPVNGNNNNSKDENTESGVKTSDDKNKAKKHSGKKTSRSANTNKKASKTHAKKSGSNAENLRGNKTAGVHTRGLSKKGSNIAPNSEGLKTNGAHADKNAKTLPQTGEENSKTGLIGLAIASIAGLLGLAGADKKRN